MFDRLSGNVDVYTCYDIFRVSEGLNMCIDGALKKCKEWFMAQVCFIIDFEIQCLIELTRCYCIVRLYGLVNMYRWRVLFLEMWMNLVNFDRTFRIILDQ